MEQPCIPHIMYTKSCSFAYVNNIACSGIRKLKVDWVFMYHEWRWLRLRPARLCSHLDVLYPGRAGEGAVPTNAPSLCLNSNNGPRSAVLPSWEYWPRWELSIGHLNFDIRNKISFKLVKMQIQLQQDFVQRSLIKWIYEGLTKYGLSVQV